MIIRVGLKKTRVVEGEEEEGGGKRGEGGGDGGGRCCDQSQQIMTKITMIFTRSLQKTHSP